MPDMENSAKLLYALLQAGFPATDARLTDLRRGLANRLLALGPPMIAADYVGLAWYVFLTHDFDLEPDLAYQRCLQLMESTIGGGWKSHFALMEFPGFRSLLVRALMTAGRRSPQVDAAVNGYVASQSESGSWPLPRALSLWGLDRPPAAGIKLGTMDGANTYLLTLTLIHYRDRISSDNSAFAVPSLSLKHRPAPAARLDDSPGATGGGAGLHRLPCPASPRSLRPRGLAGGDPENGRVHVREGDERRSARSHPGSRVPDGKSVFPVEAELVRESRHRAPASWNDFEAG